MYIPENYFPITGGRFIPQNYFYYEKYANPYALDNYLPLVGFFFYGASTGQQRAHFYCSWGMMKTLIVQISRYLPFVGFWFFGAGNSTSRAHYYVSWGLMEKLYSGLESFLKRWYWWKWWE